MKKRNQIGLPHKTNKSVFLDWINNFLTVYGMAEYYNVDYNELEKFLAHLYKNI